MNDKKCEYPRGCTVAPNWYVMGAYAGDWAVYVCGEHRQWAHDAFAPWIEEPVRHPVLESPGDVG